MKAPQALFGLVSPSAVATRVLQPCLAGAKTTGCPSCTVSYRTLVTLCELTGVVATAAAAFPAHHAGLHDACGMHNNLRMRSAKKECMPCSSVCVKPAA